MGGRPGSVESLVNMSFARAFRGRRVLVTGHTGFKGAWLSEWLLGLGADVCGFALPPVTPSLFDQLDLANRLRHIEGDIRDPSPIFQAIVEYRPEFVFHLAAQPLVRLSYENPLETYATNIMGTVHLLEAVRQTAQPCTVVAITTDKCYENREWAYSYREDDPMGGYDPYSSSKGAAELVINAYRRSFFSGINSAVRLASARAGNVIGGGDWASDRIMPDCIRALHQGQTIPVRNRASTRPWQHVLEPLSGYLWLGSCLSKDPSLASAFNFGPKLASNHTVATLVEEILKYWPGQWTDQSNPDAVHEATLLNLATDKAFHFLNWEPVWDFSQTVDRTVTWYRESLQKPGCEANITRKDIADYEADARSKGLSWAHD